MDAVQKTQVEAAREAALHVLRHNAYGPHDRLPRTAGWGYPEPYTRDLMISSLGILASGDDELIHMFRQVLVTLAHNQTARGHIPSLAHDPDNVGASDTTPLFLMGLALYRKVAHEPDFLEDAAYKALTWMAYQSPGDDVIVAQLPTSDWRDEQWVMGYGLFVNTVVFTYLRLFGLDQLAAKLRILTTHLSVDSVAEVEQGVANPHHRTRPYYALWAYKIFSSERFDLLGNSLAILAGIPSHRRERMMIQWIEEECELMQARGELAVDLPPNLFPYILPGDADWLPRYEQFNRPGEYHNGGVWPFICGFYVAAIVATGNQRLAEMKLASLADLVRPANDHEVDYGFNEWIRAQDGTPQGNDWQTWSAAMYLYAAACVEQGTALYFDDFRTRPLPAKR